MGDVAVHAACASNQREANQGESMPDDRIRTEEAIIQQFLAPLAAGFPGAFGLQDDCAVAAPAPGHEFVFKTDAIAAGVHFLGDEDARDIGWKALAVNVSDLAAKGARPVGYLLSLSFPQAPTRAWMSGFTDGLAEAQRAFGMHLMGGDTDRRPGPVSITPMVIGEVPSGRMVRRATAVVGDIVFVSGTLGDAGLGLRLRKDRSLAASWGLAAEHSADLERRYLRPAPRLELRDALRGAARAAMDVSDGVVKDLGRMCKASGVAARLGYSRLPVSAAFAAIRDVQPGEAGAALFGGDDYEVLATVAGPDANRFRAMAEASGCAVTAIGEIIEGSGVSVLDDGQRPMLVATSGWDHF